MSARNCQEEYRKSAVCRPAIYLQYLTGRHSQPLPHAYYSPQGLYRQWVAWKGIEPMTITMTPAGYVTLHTDDAYYFVAPEDLARLVADGVMHEHTPYDTVAQNLHRAETQPTGGPCFCGEPRKYGVFCEAHFEWMRTNYGFALAWEREKVWWQAQAEAQGVSRETH